MRADFQEKNKNLYEMKGHVVMTYGTMKLTADTASYDDATGIVEAQGHIVFTDPSAHLEAAKAQYNVRTGQGWFLSVHGYVYAHVRLRERVLPTKSPFYITAEKVVRVDASEYVVYHGRMTTCPTPRKGWMISAGEASVKPGDRAVSHNAVFRLMNVPVLYSPLLINSIAARPRRTGFLLPNIGNSSQKGTIIGDGFFWAINPSADLLLGIEDYSLRGVGQYGQFRADPTAHSAITANYFAVNDKGSGPLRQERAPGESLNVTGEDDNLGDGFRGVVDVNYVNSLAFRETFTNNFSEAISSEARQTGFLTKNFGADSLNFDVSRYQDFLSNQNIPDNSVIIEHTPSFSFSGMDQEIGGSPIYFSFNGSATGVSRTEPGASTGALTDRLDFHPTLSLRSKPFLGFHLTPSLGFEVTRYGASLKPGGGPLDRAFGEFSIDLRPPTLEKVFSKPYFGYRFKHVISPDIKYRLVKAADPQNILDTPLFDATDLMTETNEIEYSLTNSLLVRRATPDASGNTPQAHDLLSLSLTEAYFFNPTFGGALEPGVQNVFDPTLALTGFAFADGRRLSPIVSVLRLAPSSDYDVGLRADISPNGGVSDTGITSNLHHGPFGLQLTEFFVRRTTELVTPAAKPASPPILSTVPSFNMLRALVALGHANHRGFSGAFEMDYNFAYSATHGAPVEQAVSQVSYNFGCFGLDFEYRRFDLGPLRRENEYRVSLSLANVGTFGNLKPQGRLY